jgi:hypothetical protein
MKRFIKPASWLQRRGSERAVSDTPQIRNVFIRRPVFSGVISIVIVLQLYRALGAGWPEGSE